MATLAAGVAGACALTACGSSSGSSSKSNGEAGKTGPHVVQDASAALGASGAVHVSGSGMDSNQKSIDLDLQLQQDATSGTLTMSGQKIDIVSIGGASYIKAGSAFYESQGASAAQASKVADKWVKSTSSKDFDSFSLSGIAKDLGKTNGDSKINDKVESGTLDGQDVVIVSQTDGSKLYVAATGQPLPLKAENPKGSSNGSGSLTFKDYGSHQDIKAPADAIDVPSGGA